MYINREKTVKAVIVSVVFVCCFAIAALILHGINQFKVGSQLATINQVSNLSHLLVRQQANLLALMLVKNARSDEINEALDNFSKEEFVIDATLYAPNGTLIGQSRNAKPFQPQQSDSIESHSTQQIVEPVFTQQELAGFLRVTFNAEYGQTTRSKVNELFHLLYGELIVLFLAGGLFVSCFYVFRRKVVHLPHSPTKLSPESQKSQSQRFHSRRRALNRK